MGKAFISDDEMQKLSPAPAFISDEDMAKQADVASPLETLASSIAPSGLSSRVYAAKEAPLGALKAAGRYLGIGNPNDPDIQKFEKEKAFGRDVLEQSEAQNPRAALAGGLVIPAAATVMTGGAASPLAGVAGNAALAGAYGGIQSKADLTKGEALPFARDVGLSAGTGALLGKAAKALPGPVTGAGLGYLANKLYDPSSSGLTGAAIGGGIGAAPMLAKGALSVVGGVKPWAVNEYLEKGGLPNEVPSLPQVKENLDSVSSKILSAVDEAKENLKNKQLDVRFSQGEMKQDLANQLSQSEQALDRAHQQSIIGAGKDISAAVDQLKQATIEGSRGAKNTIADDSYVLDFNDRRKQAVVDLLSRAQNKMRVGQVSAEGQISGLGPARSDAAAASIANIDRLKDRIAQMPPSTSALDIKNLIQGLDEDLDAFYSAPRGSFASGEQAAKSNVRTYLDAILKKRFPEYKAAMQPVAENASLLSEASPAFGDEQTAINRLSGNLQGPRAEETRQLLQRLGQFSGKDYLGALNKESLPEFGQVQDLKSRIASLTPRTMSEGMAAEVAPQQQALQSANAIADKLGSLSPGNSESFINRATSPAGSSENDKAVLDALEQHIPGIKQNLQNMRLQRAFTGDSTQGSRKTLLGAVLGHVVGGLPGEVVGAGLGSSADVYGKGASQQILDKYISASQSMPGQYLSGTLQALDKAASALGGRGPIQSTEVGKQAPQFLDKYISPKQAQDQFLNGQ